MARARIYETRSPSTACSLPSGPAVCYRPRRSGGYLGNDRLGAVMLRAIFATYLLLCFGNACLGQSLSSDARTCETVMKSCKQFCANNPERRECAPDCSNAYATCRATGVFRTQNSAVSVLNPPKSARKTSVDKSCCMTQSAKCDDFCHTPAGIAQGASCSEACRRFVSFCEKTGKYVWRGGRTVECTGG